MILRDVVGSNSILWILAILRGVYGVIGALIAFLNIIPVFEVCRPDNRDIKYDMVFYIVFLPVAKKELRAFSNLKLPHVL